MALTDEKKIERIKNRLSKMSRDEIEDYALGILTSNSESYLCLESKEQIQKEISNILKEHLMETIQKTDFIKRLLFGINYNGEINLVPKSNFESIVTEMLKDEAEGIKAQFADGLKECIQKNMDNLVRNLVFRIFMHGLAKDVITTDLFTDALNNRD